MSAAQTFAQHPYADFLHLVEKPARYTGGEVGAKRKDWSAVEATICLAFPDVYDIGMSHLGYKILYSILNADGRTLAERAYTPWPDMEKELRTRGVPLVSHESARPLRDFDVVGLSLQYELTYSNCLTILDLGGIPLRAADRGDADPLVLGGGPVATHPEPVAPFFDAFVLGDGEDACRDVALAWAKMKREGVPRRERLIALAGMEGVYVPSLYDIGVADETGFQVVVGTKDARVPRRVRRTFLADISKYPFPKDSPVGGPEAIFDRMSIEISRGCTEGCRFCQAGMIYRPVRERDPDEIVETVVDAVQRAGYDEASLTSLSTADHSCISPLLKKVVERLTPERVSLSVSSLRAYGLPDDLLDELRRVRASGLTFAPEAGTQRMRDVINKNVTEEQLLETAGRVFGKGWDRMKLYFMIGLPTETAEDVRGIIETGRRALEEGKKALRAGGGKSMRKPTVTVSVSTHVPKPHTPFQWCAMDALETVREKQAMLRSGARAAKVDLKMHSSDESILEGIFARGDRRLADVIERAWRGGARFDSWEEHVRLDIWKEALAHFEIDTARHLGTIPIDARLPWDHLDVGLEDGFLAREYRKALRSRLSPPCGKAAGMFVHHTNVEDAASDGRRLVCYDCGVACDMTAMREERLGFLAKLGAHRRLPLLGAANASDDVVGAGDFAAGSIADSGTAESGIAENVVGETGLEGSDGDENGLAADDVFLGPEEPAPVAKKKKAPPPKPVFRYRLAYEKLGPIAYLGHLDLIRALPRVFRRVLVPLAYTQGFHPKPDLVFGPALSLGVPSLDEYVDVKLFADIDPAELLGRLNAGVPEGLRFTAAAKLGPEDRGVTRVITGARWALAFARKALLGGEEALREKVAAALAAETLPVRREIERNVKTIDVRTYLVSAVVSDPAAVAAVAAAGLLGDLVVVGIETRIPGSGAVKASEVAAVLAGADVPCKAVRISLLADELTPMEIVGRARPAREDRVLLAEGA